MLRRTPLLALCLTAFAGAAPPTTAPTTHAVDTSRADAEQEQATLPHLPPGPVEDVLQLQLDDGCLVARSPVGGEDGSFAVTFPKWPGFGVYTQHDNQAVVSLKHTAFSEHDTVQSITEVQKFANQLNTSRDTEWPLSTDDPDGPSVVRSVQLLQSRDPNVPANDSIKLLIQVTRSDDAGDHSVTTDNPPPPPADPRQAKAMLVQLTAHNFAELCRDHPAAVHDYLLPIFKDLDAAALLRGSDPAKAWQVLGKLTPPDEAMKTKIDALLKRLDSDDFADRSKAEQELLATGTAGAVELSRRDLTKLPPDPRAVAENAMRRNLPLSDQRAAELASNVPFLLETLTLDDNRLVTAAAKRLGEVTGKSIDLPSNLSAAERTRRIEAYTATLGPATRPTPRENEAP